MNNITAHISEKSLKLVEENQYTFSVSKDATKGQVKSFVKKMYKVDPISVNIVNIKGKVKGQGQKSGQRANISKAIVRLNAKQKIAEFNVGETNEK
ncbi:MAG: 50S ribosomal protein L23 [Patescibacteria group bacterium]|jgi:large subunit ribosomal protein L23